MLLVENIGLFIFYLKGTLNTVYRILTQFLVEQIFNGGFYPGTQRHLVDTATGASSLETLYMLIIFDGN
jgi:hypothetical protein